MTRSKQDGLTNRVSNTYAFVGVEKGLKLHEVMDPAYQEKAVIALGDSGCSVIVRVRIARSCPHVLQVLLKKGNGNREEAAETEGFRRGRSRCEYDWDVTTK